MLETLPLGSIYFAWSAAMAVAPIRRPRAMGTASWLLSSFPNELPFVFLAIVAGSNIPILAQDVLSTRDRISLVLAAITVVALVVVVVRALRTRPVVERALTEALGAGWRGDLDTATARSLRRHLPWMTVLFAPWTFRRRHVTRLSNLSYGDGGKAHLLDVYRHRSRPDHAPTLVYLHGGGFRWGRKSREARALIFRLASQGWTCISANYHLSRTPAEGFPTHLIDVKKLIAWARTDGRAHGVDPDAIFLAGSSAGAHLTAMAALTANDPAFQPGFEQADTSITAGIGLGGYYGSLGDDDHPPTTPLAYDGPSPPFFVVHGTQDTYTPVDGARRLVEHLRSTTTSVVAYAELPGAQHSFDLFNSIRFETVVDAIEAFTSWVRAQQTKRSACQRMAVTGTFL